MKNPPAHSRILRGIAAGLVLTGLSFSLLLARAQSTAAPAAPKAERDAAARADLDALFDVQKPHLVVEKSSACPEQPCAPCPCQAAAATCALAPGSCPALTPVQPNARALEVAALFDVQVIPHKSSKVPAADRK